MGLNASLYAVLACYKIADQTRCLLKSVSICFNMTVACCASCRYISAVSAGRAVMIMCLDPAISSQACGMSTLAASERMMPV